MKNIHIYILLFFGTFLLGMFQRPLLDLILRPLTQAGASGLLIAVVPIIFSFVVLLVLFLSAAKPAILKALSQEQELLPLDFYELPNLDADNLALYSHSLESLGFTCLGDYQLNPTSTKGILRLFSHPEHYCFAEVGQVFSERQLNPTFYTIASAFEQNWSLFHRHHDMSGFLGGLSYMMRQKRHLWANYSNASPEELLRIHLECRQRIVADLGLRVLTDMSVEAFNSYTRDYCRTKKSLFVGLIEAFLFSLHPKTEWMGEYASRRKI